MVQIITTTVGNPISSTNHEIKIGMVANVHAYLLLTILLGIGGTTSLIVCINSVCPAGSQFNIPFFQINIGVQGVQTR